MLNTSSNWTALRSTDDRSLTLRPDARSMDGNTVRSSLEHNTPSKYQATVFGSSLMNQSKQQQAPLSTPTPTPQSTRSLRALSTPHDHILEKMYKQPQPGKSEGFLPFASEVTEQPSDHSQNSPISLKDVNEQTEGGTTSVTPTVSVAHNTFTAGRLYDPFDGSPIGITLPAEVIMPDVDPTVLNEEARYNEVMWSHLSKVLELQNEIAKMHVDMEGIGKQVDGKGKGKGKGKGPLGGPSRATGFTRPRSASTSSAHGADIGDEEGAGVVDEEAEKLHAREKGFKLLATQFEGRKEAINEMMGRLDDLSKVLTEFHSSPIPNIEFSPTRNNSLSPTASEPTHTPVVVPPSGDTSPLHSGLSENQNRLRSPSIPYAGTNLNKLGTSSHPTEGIHLSAPLTRKGLVPAVIINSLEPGAQQKHLVESPTSTASLQLPQEES